VETNSSAIVDCALRLFVETGIKQSIVAAVIVPQRSFGRITTDMARFNFFPVQAGGAGSKDSLTVHVVSYPDGEEAFFCRQI
ncbi:MAG TPA: hypothetical protein V6C72_18300, partial [Chroococcales cyanobacterium]